MVAQLCRLTLRVSAVAREIIHVQCSQIETINATKKEETSKLSCNSDKVNEIHHTPGSSSGIGPRDRGCSAPSSHLKL